MKTAGATQDALSRLSAQIRELETLNQHLRLRGIDLGCKIRQLRIRR